jgi:outer membrane immunogenic protein
MKRILLTTAAAVAIVSTASAADLRPRPFAPVLPPPFSWTGCYLGGCAGGAWVDDITVTNAYGQAVVLPANTWSLGLDSSFIGGGTLGCNWQPIGTPWVFGIEGELGYIDLSGSASVPFGPNFIFASAKIGNTYGMVTGRLGYAVDRVLFYVKGGAAFVDESVTVSHPALVGITPAFVATASNDDARWTIGGGMEWAFANNWTLKAEYMFIGSDNNSPCAFNPGVVGGVQPGNYCWNQSGFNGINTFKVGLNYLFGGGWPFGRY